MTMMRAREHAHVPCVPLLQLYEASALLHVLHDLEYCLQGSTGRHAEAGYCHDDGLEQLVLLLALWLWHAALLDDAKVEPVEQ